MENDSVRPIGESTVVDMWIDGKMRSISVAREAIERFLQLAPDHAAAMTEHERCEFVRTHLGLVVTSAKNRLRHMAGNGSSIAISPGDLGAEPGEAVADRRQAADRRRGDRRKADRPVALDRRRNS
jgi:hypothetical protein